MKNSVKGQMEMAVKAMSVKVDTEKNIYTVDVKNKDQVLATIEAFGKFSVINNKNDENIKAVAYTTKKSAKFMYIKFIKVVEKKQENKKEKEMSILPTFKFKFTMLKDKGLDHHIAEFEMRIQNEEQVNYFLDLVNEKLTEYDLGKVAEYESVERDENDDMLYHGTIIFPKVKGDSKPAYVHYKASLTSAKRNMKL